MYFYVGIFRMYLPLNNRREQALAMDPFLGENRPCRLQVAGRTAFFELRVRSQLRPAHLAIQIVDATASNQGAIARKPLHSVPIDTSLPAALHPYPSNTKHHGPSLLHLASNRENHISHVQESAVHLPSWNTSEYHSS
jgi:hypothetical protein